MGRPPMDRDVARVESAIEAAARRGDFDDLPGAGKPLDLPDTHDPDWWVNQRIASGDIDSSALLPVVVLLRKEYERRDETLAVLPDEKAVREYAADYRAVHEDRRANPFQRISPGLGRGTTRSRGGTGCGYRGARRRRPRTPGPSTGPAQALVEVRTTPSILSPRDEVAAGACENRCGSPDGQHEHPRVRREQEAMHRRVRIIPEQPCPHEREGDREADQHSGGKPREEQHECLHRAVSDDAGRGSRRGSPMIAGPPRPPPQCHGQERRDGESGCLWLRPTKNRVQRRSEVRPRASGAGFPETCTTGIPRAPPPQRSRSPACRGGRWDDDLAHVPGRDPRARAVSGLIVTRAQPLTNAPGTVARGARRSPGRALDGPSTDTRVASLTAAPPAATTSAASSAPSRPVARRSSEPSP